MHVCCVQVRPVSCAKFDVDRTVNNMKNLRCATDLWFHVADYHSLFWFLFLYIICTFAVISVDYVFAWTFGQ